MSWITDLATLRLAEILADGQWHRLDEVEEQLLPLVPPGPAIRRNERDRIKHWRKDDPKRRTKRVMDLSEEDQIRGGAKSIIRDLLRMKCIEKSPWEGPSATRTRYIRMVRPPRNLARIREYEEKGKVEGRVRE